MKKITREYPGVTALCDVDMTISAGEVVALVGANGAGKSTLSHIISGADKPTGGEIYVNGKRVAISNANIAEALGIEMVHQEPTLVPNMEVYTNLFLNRELKKRGILNKEKMRAEARRILEYLGFKIDPEKRVIQLSLVEKTVVEIAKALLSEPKLLILDEVTAPLNDREADRLFEVIAEMKSKGLAIVFISHKMHELVRIADRIVVLKDGKNAGELFRGTDFTEQNIIRMMLGDTAEFKAVSNAGRRQETKEHAIAVRDFSNKCWFHQVDFEVGKGEIVGFAGLKGSGVTEMFKSIFGVLAGGTGQIFLGDKPAEIKNIGDAIEHGIGFITNDRQHEGLALIRSVGENISICSLKSLKKGGIIEEKKYRKLVEHYIRELQIKTPSQNQLVRNLSGGNQQKIVIAKWLARNPGVLLFDEPTRGVDVHAKNEIYRLMMKQKEQGKALLVSSPEIPELLNICDRIFIMADGSIISELKRDQKEFNEADILERIHSKSKTEKEDGNHGLSGRY